MRFLWQSNAPWAGTGYGVQTRLLLPALRDMEHQPHCFCFYGLQGGTIEYDGYTCWPTSPFDEWGNDTVEAHIKTSKSEAIVTLMDLFVLKPPIWSRLKVPWAAWVPIDAEEIGMGMQNILKNVDYPIAMSHFGAEEFRKVGVEPAAVIYHAVDTEVFQPMDKWECRRELEIDEDCYLIGLVMANKGDRKQFPAHFQAIRQWMDEHSDRDVKVLIHTDPTDSMYGWDMRELIMKTGLTGKVHATNQYFSTVVPVPQDTLAKMYNSMDVLMNVSAGEGFGVPIVEAQACGVPVITHGVTAMPELTINGYTVEPAFKGLANHYGWQFNPKVEDMVYRLECVYRMSDKQKSLDGVQWVRENCSVPVIANQWDQVLTYIQQRSQEQKLEVVHHPEPLLPEVIQEARRALVDAPHYGTYRDRYPEYQLLFDNMVKLGLKNGDYVLDIGAGYADLDRHLREQGWTGVYVPVDLAIDGTDIADWEPLAGFNFVVLSEVIEHISKDEAMELLRKCEERCGAVLITTPNGEVLNHDTWRQDPGQMMHAWHPVEQDFIEQGYIVGKVNFSGTPDDTLFAYKLCNIAEASNGSRAAETVPG